MSKFGLCGDLEEKKNLSPMFLQQNKFDKYLNHLEMRPWQGPGKCNGTFAVSYVRI